MNRMNRLEIGFEYLYLKIKKKGNETKKCRQMNFIAIFFSPIFFITNILCYCLSFAFLFLLFCFVSFWFRFISFQHLNTKNDITEQEKKTSSNKHFFVVVRFVFLYFHSEEMEDEEEKK